MNYIEATWDWNWIDGVIGGLFAVKDFLKGVKCVQYTS